jgi:hypothetical protein
VARANDVARSDNPNSQFVIIFVHWAYVQYRSCKLGRPLCELNLTAFASCAFNHGFFGEKDVRRGELTFT